MGESFEKCLHVDNMGVPVRSLLRRLWSSQFDEDVKGWSLHSDLPEFRVGIDFVEAITTVTGCLMYWLLVLCKAKLPDCINPPQDSVNHKQRCINVWSSHRCISR